MAIHNPLAFSTEADLIKELGQERVPFLKYC